MNEINAKISSTQLGFEDHGILTCWLMLEWHGSGQGFGGYKLDGAKGVPHKACSYFVSKILQTVGVEDWEDLKGQLVRIKQDSGRIHAIGHITEDKWFEPAKDKTWHSLFPLTQSKK